MADYIRREDAITAAYKGFCHPGVRCPYNWMKSAECITTLMCDALELLEKDGEE